MIKLMLGLSLVFFGCSGQAHISNAVDAQSSNIAVTDSDLNRLANENGYQFYQNDPEWLPFTPRGGGHAGVIRTRFNSIAQTVLDSEGKLPIGAQFPEGSVVVKEIKSRIEQAGTILAIMLKSSGAANAGAGWVWGEYDVDGSLIASATESGRQCVRCHSITSSNSPVAGDQGHRDFVRTFGLRP